MDKFVGKKITCQGVTLTIKSVISAHDYSRDKNKPCWYIEFIAEEDGKSHYWKQDVDGGSIS